MAMNAGTMGTAIKNQLISDGYALAGDDIEGIWQSIATAMIAHMQANAVISTAVTTVVATPDTLVGTGSGSGTGTIA